MRSLGATWSFISATMAKSKRLPSGVQKTLGRWQPEIPEKEKETALLSRNGFSREVFGGNTGDSWDGWSFNRKSGSEIFSLDFATSWLFDQSELFFLPPMRLQWVHGMCPQTQKKITWLAGNAAFLMGDTSSRWWFQIFFIFTSIWGRFLFWLIFFRWVETTNQSSFMVVFPIVMLLFKGAVRPSESLIEGSKLIHVDANEIRYWIFT